MISTRLRARFGFTYVSLPYPFLVPFAQSDHIDGFAPVQLLMKTVKVEAFFNFTFGTGRDKNLVCDLTEFVDSKVFASGSSGDSSDGSSDA